MKVLLEKYQAEAARAAEENTTLRGALDAKSKEIDTLKAKPEEKKRTA